MSRRDDDKSIYGYTRYQMLSTRGQYQRWKNALRVMLRMKPHTREQHFDMSRFGIKTDCGTIGCVMGFCGLDKWFRQRHFKLRFQGEQGFMDGNAYDFFGSHGERIFMNTATRSWETVVAEMQPVVDELKREAYGK
jgi:hypothetical protein